MKNYIFIAACLLVFLSSCTNSQKDKLLLQERDSLLNVINEHESSLNQFIASINNIEEKLDSVSFRQNIILITKDKSDFNANQKSRINEQISAINYLMNENTLKIRELNLKLKKSNTKNVNLQKTIDLLNNRLNKKYNELMELNQQFADLKAEVFELQIAIIDLSSENKAQAEYIDTKIAELHTAYYIVGTSGDLIESKLIDKSGGLLGIGKTAKLSNNLDPKMFVKIDYLQTTAIQINSKHAKIITSHPTDSYSFDKSGTVINNLLISDPEKFWSASKYLVITK